MLKIGRRSFLAGAAGAAAGAFAAETEKVADGGFAEVSLPGVPKRKTPLVPPGAESLENFTRKCVGCQVCVQQCPSNVLRPSLDPARFMQPEMGFERGYCREECTRCGRVCPTGAIRPVSREEKRHIHLGHAIWHKENCLAAQEGVMCDACAHKCPVNAILMIPLVEGNPAAPKVPVIDKLRYIGCGACEHVCPARPMPGISVKGFEKHRAVRPMGETEALDEAAALIGRGKISAALVKGGVIIATYSGRGIAPLLELLDRRPEEFRGAWVADKVVGRAAAAICVAGGAKHVYGALMSRDAKEFLEAAGVGCSSGSLAERIENRDRTGLCPMEQAVAGLAAPGEMVAAVRRKLAELRGAKPAAAK